MSRQKKTMSRQKLKMREQKTVAILYFMLRHFKLIWSKAERQEVLLRQRNLCREKQQKMTSCIATKFFMSRPKTLML